MLPHFVTSAILQGSKATFEGHQPPRNYFWIRIIALATLKTFLPNGDIWEITILHKQLN